MRLCCTLLIWITFILPCRAQWVSQSSPFVNRVYEKVFFITPQTGFITGWNGAILKTSDGGDSWNYRFSTTIFNLRDIIFRDTLEGFAAGEYQTIVRTTNGGNSWQQIYQQQSKYLNALAYHDSLIIAAGDSGLMITSIDSGHNWSTVSLPTLADIQDIWITAEGKIILAGEGGQILSKAPSDTAWISIVSGTSLMLQDIFFADSNTGYIAGGQFGTSSSGVILKSTDGGDTWQNLNVPSLSQQNGIYFTSPDTGFAAGAKGTILKTNNGGSSWSLQVSGTLNSLNGLFFSSRLTGFTVGDGSKILRTTNAGGKVSLPDSELNLPQLKIYPNPTNGIIYLDHAADFKIESAELIDISGRGVFFTTDTERGYIDLHELLLTPGFYFLRIAYAGGFVFTKLRLQ